MALVSGILVFIIVALVIAIIICALFRKGVSPKFYKWFGVLLMVVTFAIILLMVFWLFSGLSRRPDHAWETIRPNLLIILTSVIFGFFPALFYIKLKKDNSWIKAAIISQSIAVILFLIFLIMASECFFVGGTCWEGAAFGLAIFGVLMLIPYGFGILCLIMNYILGWFIRKK